MATEKNIIMRQFNGTDYDTLYPKTKVEQVEGVYTQQQILADSTKGLYGLDATAVPDDVFLTLFECLPQIFVTTVPNIEVTASLNGKTVRATSDSSGLAVLKVYSYGIWTISANIYGVAVSIDCEIKTIAQYELLLLPTLEKTSWDDISSISESGIAATLWSIGDKKTVTIGGVNYEVQIIGFNHDTKTTGGTAGITFQTVDCMNDTAMMNAGSSNNGGWTGCAMRTSTIASLLTKLPSELKNVIKAVNKLTSAGRASSNINTTSDKLFLLSEVEIFGSATYSFAGEGSQYAYYKAGNSRAKKVKGSTYGWWERSPYKNSNVNFCFVDSTGGRSNTAAVESFGVSFAFCV